MRYPPARRIDAKHPIRDPSGLAEQILGIADTLTLLPVTGNEHAADAPDGHVRCPRVASDGRRVAPVLAPAGRLRDSPAATGRPDAGHAAPSGLPCPRTTTRLRR
jgi:hypothetical protein